MSLDGQQVSNILDKIKEALPDGDHDKIAEIIYRAVARKIVEDLKPSGSCFPGFRAIRKDSKWVGNKTEFKIVYVDGDGGTRHHSFVFVDPELAEEFAAHFGSCKCHG